MRTDRDAAHATVDASFVDEGFRAGGGDPEREASQLVVAEELPSGDGRNQLVDGLFRDCCHVDSRVDSPPN